MSRRVVVTGGARGIGARIAAEFAEHGDQVVSMDLRAADQPRDENVRNIEVDVSDPDAVIAAFADLERVDVLVNNAGIQRVGLVGEQDVSDWLKVVQTNLHGAYFCCHAAIPRMSEGAAIVSIASTAAFVGLPGRSAYSAAKAGLLGLTRTLAVELAPRGIRANAVCPGFTKTDLIQQGIDDGSLDADWMMDRVPMKRLAEVQEIARAVCWLAGPDASFVTGQSLPVDGGWSIQGIGEAPQWLASK
jgi:NAD(P)-dependent dehydrogenase (short-subunit alcohol dehydrogenase family)